MSKVWWVVFIHLLEEIEDTKKTFRNYLTCRIHWIDEIISWFSFIFYRYLVDFPQQRLLPTRISFSENKTATALRNFIATCELRPHLRKSCYEQKTPHNELKSFLNKHLYFHIPTFSRDLFFNLHNFLLNNAVIR